VNIGLGWQVSFRACFVAFPARKEYLFNPNGFEGKKLFVLDFEVIQSGGIIVLSRQASIT